MNRYILHFFLDMIYFICISSDKFRLRELERYKAERSTPRMQLWGLDGLRSHLTL